MRRDGGFASIQFVVAAGLAMFMVVGLVQLVSYQYTRGAVMAALERGVRAGSLTDADAARCREAVGDSLGSVLDGEVGGTIRFGCVVDGSLMRAWATGTLPSWMPGVPELSFDLETRARREVEG